MGLEEVENDIRSEYAERAERLKVETAERIGKLISEADEDGINLLKKTEAEVSELLESKKKRKMAVARLEAKRVVMRAKEVVVEKAIDAVKQRLVDFTKSPEYPKALNRYVKAGASKINGDVRVTVRKKDRKLIDGFSLTDEDLDCIGGAIVTSSDSQVLVDATLDQMFKDVRPILRQKIIQGLST